MSVGGGLQREIQYAIEAMEVLKVAELKAVCRSIELPVSGRKSVLQDHIRDFLKNSLAIGHIDPWRPKAVRVLIHNASTGTELPKYTDLWLTLKTGGVQTRLADPSTGTAVNGAPVGPLPGLRTNLSQTHATQPPVGQVDRGVAGQRNITPGAASRKTAGATKQTIKFKPSPFYNILKSIPGTAQKVKKTSGRAVALSRFKISIDDWQLLNQPNGKYKLLLFSGELQTQDANGFTFVQFPAPNEIRMNNHQIKDNVKGLKNKPGTAKPANLTPYVKPFTEPNTLEFIYAFTKSEFMLYCCIVESINADQILQSVLSHPKILKSATVRQLKKALSEEDDDLVTTSTVLSLQCPISYTRMKYPAKSIMCKHLQCFDALWFLYSQEQVPTWQCPVCPVIIDIRNLAICEYVAEILENTNETVEQVELSTDGSWTAQTDDDNKTDRNESSEKKTQNDNKNDDVDDDDDDDIPMRSHVKREATTERLPSVSDHNEPMVISLDSDEDYDEEPIATTRHQPASRMLAPLANDSIENRNTSHADITAPISTNTYRPRNDTQMNHGNFVDTNNSQSTLDPRHNVSFTESDDIRGHEHSSQFTESSQSLGRHANSIPNLLGKTPLRNDGSYDPQLLVPPSVTTSPSHHLSGPSRTLDPNRRSSAPSNQNLRNTIPPNINFTSESFIGLTNDTNDNPAISSNGKKTNGNVQLPHLYAIDPMLPRPEIPRLPEIPSDLIHNRIPRPPERDRGVPSRRHKPEVSPFIPRKHYPTLIPQKRSLPNTNTQAGARSTVNDRSSSSDSIIDLTTD